MEHAVGICDLTGQTHTECVAYEGMIDGCQVILTADWCLSEVRCSTVVQKWNLLGDCLSAQPGLHLQLSTISIRKSNRVCIRLHYHLPHHNLS